jgi:O-acetylhomoserine/O-acetylserine sulfhydrylase-like pyridoxal-dependent enzyme
VTNEPDIYVIGATSVEAITAVNGVPVVLDEAGLFAVLVPLESGANFVEVSAIDLAGGSRSETAVVFYVPG